MVAVKFTPLPKGIAEADNLRLKIFRQKHLFPERNSPIPVISGPSDSTVKKYYLLLRQLARFSLLVHCDQTRLLLFCELCPDMPGPVVVSTLCAFMSYKMCQGGTLVQHHLTTKPVLSHLGHQIVAQGGWNEGSTIEALHSALSHLHNLYPELLGSNLAYKPDCSACAKLFSQHVNPASTPRPCN
jgi:hypothetical protein